MDKMNKRWTEWWTKGSEEGQLLPALKDVYLSGYKQGFLDGQVEATKKETTNGNSGNEQIERGSSAQ